MKKNLPMIVGVALPLVFIAIISIFIFLPSAFVKPEHNFVYTSDDGYYGDYYANTFKVENDHVTLEPNIPPPQDRNLVSRGMMPDLYLYNVKDNTSHKIAFEEAKKMVLDPGPTSPDGYTVSYNYGHDGIFEIFGSDNGNNGYFISKGNGQKKLIGLTGDRYWGQNNFKLIGWVK